MNLRNIFTTALGCFTILAACGNDNDSNITPTPEPKPDQPTEEAKDVTLYVTNTSRTYDLTKSGLAFGTGSNMSPSTVTLDPATRYQEMDGFGAAITGSTGYNLMQMTQENRTKFLTETFSDKEGYGFSYVRIAIGCSDFSFSEFTCCDEKALCPSDGRHQICDSYIEGNSGNQSCRQNNCRSLDMSEVDESEKPGETCTL